MIKLLGAGYLIYMGVGSMMAKRSKLDLTATHSEFDLTRFQAFRIGFLTNVLNPKATLFFLSLFTLVIGNSTPLYIILTISFIIIGTALSWFAIVSVFLTRQEIQRIFLKYEKGINRILGGFLVLLGIKVAFTLL